MIGGFATRYVQHLGLAAIAAAEPGASGQELVRSLDDDWGRSESIDPDDVGDIADEGAGHRG
jgi:hypothetical protein